MNGPFEDSSTFIAMNGPGEAYLFERELASIMIPKIFVDGWLSKRLLGFVARCWERWGEGDAGSCTTHMRGGRE